MSSSALFRTSIVVLDTETTGLPSDPDAEPWEFGAVLLDWSGREVRHLDVRGQPTVLRDNMTRAVQMGGFTLSELHALPPLATYHRQVRAWMGAALAQGARITSYGRAFDRTMLARVGLAWPDECWTRCILDETGGMPLWAATRRWGVVQVLPEHRALSDARTAAGVMVAIQAARAGRT